MGCWSNRRKTGQARSRCPFDFVKTNLNGIDISRLRTSQTRIRFIGRMKGVIDDCRTWDDAVFKISGIK